jgi:nucleoside-diphosphate-sugar epimerase
MNSKIDKLILVTGASGFIGLETCIKLLQRGYRVRAVYVSQPEPNEFAELKKIWVNKFEPILLNKILDQDSWNHICNHVYAIVHLGGKAHVSENHNRSSRNLFYKNNLLTSKLLGNAAIKNKVPKFIFSSTIGVNGESTNGYPFTEKDVPSPRSYYAKSKYFAELALQKIYAKEISKLVILRPPLIYGSDVKGNFLKLLKLLTKAPVVPFKLIKAKRSYLDRDNFIDFIILCIENNNSGGRTFILSDNNDLDFSQLCSILLTGLNMKYKLLSIPIPIFKLASKFLPKDKLKSLQKVLTELEVDSSHARTIMNWHPSKNPKEGLLAMTSHFRQSKRK